MIWTSESIRKYCEFELWPVKYSVEELGEDGTDTSEVIKHVTETVDFLVVINDMVRAAGKFLDAEVFSVPYPGHSIDIYYEGTATFLMNYHVISGKVDYYAFPAGAPYDGPAHRKDSIDGTFTFPEVTETLKTFIIENSKPLSEEVL